MNGLMSFETSSLNDLQMTNRAHYIAIQITESENGGKLKGELIPLKKNMMN